LSLLRLKKSCGNHRERPGSKENNEVQHSAAACGVKMITNVIENFTGFSWFSVFQCIHSSDLDVGFQTQRALPL
jgi:hypothetical protein